MKRTLKILLLILVLGSLAAPLASCAKSDSASAEGKQTVTVQRGDLTVDITGVGNLALSQKVDLAFEMDGTVEEVLVEEGDSVEEGQVLANLDTSAWEDQLAALEDNVKAAERNVPAKERAVTAAERGVTQAKRAVTQAEDAVPQAELQIKARELAVVQAEINLDNAVTALQQLEDEDRYNWLDIELRELQVKLAKGNLDDAKVQLENAKNNAVPDAEQAVEDAKLALEDAKVAVEDAKVAVEDAQKALDKVNSALEDARNESPEIIAPFSGFITNVNVSGGDEVKKGTVAVTLADPEKFEAEILVSELDIFNIQLGAQASIQVDALSGLSLPAEVTFISPTATVQSGVVNFKVKVELQSLESVMQQQQQARQEAMANVTPEGLSERLKQAVEDGRITQEQADEMMQQMQQGQGALQGQVPADISQGYQLREGLTVTVSIIVNERNDVVLVPNQAITTRGRQNYVQVLAADGTVEERAITTGIADWQYTEVTDGLSQGEQVIIPQGTTSSTSTTQQQRPSNGMFMFGGR